MKNVLLATTVLVMTGTMAAAEGLTLSGSGRFGWDYNSEATFNSSQLNMRMRVNIDGSKETDSGVTFGGRIRLQYNNGDTAASFSPAYVYAKYEGWRLEVGNSNTAYDSTALMYNSEVGYLGRSFGNPNGNYYSFSSGAYDVTEADRMGIFFSYSAGGFNGRLSYVTPDQTGATAVDEEIGISLDYDFGQFTVAAAYADGAAGVATDSVAFLGAEYAINDMANVGLLLFNYDSALAADDSTRVTLYGNYTFDAWTVRGYVATDDEDGLASDVAYGVGADYDLGGATLAGDIHRSYAEETIAGLGVKFDF